MDEGEAPELQRGPFDYVAPTPASVESIKIVRAACKALQLELLAEVLPSRERSLALTKLEEVSMWANKGIVFNQGQETD